MQNIRTKRIKKSTKIVVDYNNFDTYDNIKDKIKPYDLIGFRGGDLISDFIAHLESRQVNIGVFSHVGMVVTSDILPVAQYKDQQFNLVPGRLYVLESTFSYKIPLIMDNSSDVITKHGELGVQLRDLEEVIPRYITDQTTKVAWCRLINNPIDRFPGESDDKYESRRVALRHQFNILFHEYYGRSYELNIFNMFAAMFPCLRTIRKIQDSIINGFMKCIGKFEGQEQTTSPAGWQFCSELVANIYQAIGIIPTTFNSEDVLPVDFLGYDKDGLPALVAPPVFIQDWDLPNKPAIKYIPN